MPQLIGVVGASARAAVHSLARADIAAWAVDLFADRDLARVADCAPCPVEKYPGAIPELAAQFPPGPVLYTGGLENHPNVLRELARTRELWGNPPGVVERVRDPFMLFPALAHAGFATPRLVPRDEPCPADGRWLRKPLYSGGGRGIRFAHPREGTSPHQYFQDYIGGAPRSVAFSGTTLLGVTEQLIGEPWLHAKPFAYCGNVGPVSEAGPALARLLHLGRFLAGPCGLRAQWGIDFVLNGEVPYPVEVNPRYTAGMEVMEYGLGRSVFQQWVESGRAARGTVGKAIYYAPDDLTFPRSGPWYADLEGEFDPWRLPGFADIPAAGSRIEAGSPVLTFFATGSAPLEVRARLQSRAAELDLLFQEAQP